MNAAATTVLRECGPLCERWCDGVEAMVASLTSPKPEKKTMKANTNEASPGARSTPGDDPGANPGGDSGDDPGGDSWDDEELFGSGANPGGDSGSDPGDYPGGASGGDPGGESGDDLLAEQPGDSAPASTSDRASLPAVCRRILNRQGTAGNARTMTPYSVALREIHKYVHPLYQTHARPSISVLTISLTTVAKRRVIGSGTSGPLSKASEPLAGRSSFSEHSPIAELICAIRLWVVA